MIDGFFYYLCATKYKIMFEVIISSVIITVITLVLLLTFFKSKIVWWEILLLLVMSVLVAMIFRYFAVDSLTKDTEYWGTRFERVEYHERWNEYIYQTCTRTCCCDSKGNNCSTETYDCSYVQNHPAKWIKVDHLGRNHYTSKGEYNRLKTKNGNNQFTDMRRDYHTVDGDMYYTLWNKDTATYECITTEHTYENKTQAVPNVFEYADVDSSDIETYQLFEYPRIYKHNQRSLLGYTDKKASKLLQILNGNLGNKKQVKVFILVYNNQPMEAANLQEALWKGGNKNEFIIPISIDDNSKPIWCLPFSWCEKELAKVNIRDYVLEQDKLNLSDIVRYSHKQIKKNYKRKEFADFDYLEVKLTTNQYIWNIIISLILNFGLSMFVIHNAFRDYDPRYPWNR